MLRALVLLVHALFREGWGKSKEPGTAIIEHPPQGRGCHGGRFHLVQPRLPMSCDREAVALIDNDTAWDLISRDLSHPPGPPPGKPKRSLSYAYIGGGVARQPEDITGLVIRTRYIGLTAAVITAAKLLSW